MTLKLNGSSSGHVNLDAKAAAASNTLTLPDTASGELIAKDSSGLIDLRGDNTSVTGGTTAALTATNTLRFTDTDTTAATDQPIGSIQFQSTDSSGAGLAATIAGCQSSTAYSQLDFHTGKATESSGNNQVQRRVRIDQDNVTLYTGNLKFNTAGKGISFDAHAAENLLNDYEEGTWTPSFTSGVGSGTFSNNKYIKVGKLVTCCCRMSSMSTFTSGHAIQISLPFTADGTPIATGTVQTHKVDYISDDVVNVCPYVMDSAGSMRIYQSRKDGDWSSMVAQYLESESQIYVSLTYFAAS